jgi:hypothetical protein
MGQLYNGWNDYLPYWKNAGDLHVLPAPELSNTNSLNHFQQSDAAISDASFLRLKNVSISYHFPDQWMSRLNISSFQIYLQGQNLITLTHFNGYDPENAGNSNLVVPPLKMLTAGIKCSF